MRLHKEFLEIQRSFRMNRDEDFLHKEFLKIEELLKINRAHCEEKGYQSQIKNNEKQIWLFLYKYMSEYYDGGTGSKDINAIAYVMKGYDPQKGSLENFVNAIWAQRRKMTRTEAKKPKTTSIDQPVGADDARNPILDTIPTPEGKDPTPDETIRTNEKIKNIIDITNCIINLSADDDRTFYHKMFYTGNITAICKYVDIDNLALANREKDIWSEMNIKFLDFYMKGKCETLKSICTTDLKVWKDLLEEYGKIESIKKIVQKEIGKGESEVGLPLDNAVYQCFLLSIDIKRSKSSISQDKAKYNNLLKCLGLGTIIKYGKSANRNGQSENDIIRSYRVHSPIGELVLECLASYEDKIKDKKDKKIKTKKLYEMIKVSMAEQCEAILECYKEINELNLNEEYMLNEEFIMSYVKAFIDDWKTRLDEKYNYYRKRVVRNHVAESIERVALREIEKEFPSVGEEKMQVMLKSLHIEFAEKKLPIGITICDAIARNAAAQKERRIVDYIAKETMINRRLILDVVRYLKTGVSETGKKIAGKIQDANIYNYFWA